MYKTGNLFGKESNSWKCCPKIPAPVDHFNDCKDNYIRPSRNRAAKNKKGGEKKSKKQVSQKTKELAKKNKIALTYMRGGKRYKKTEKILLRQLNKKKLNFYVYNK